MHDVVGAKNERYWGAMRHYQCLSCMTLLARVRQKLLARNSISTHDVRCYLREEMKNLALLSHFRQANKKIDIRAWVQYMHVYMHAYIHTHTCNLYIYHTYIHHTKATHTCTYIINTYPYIHTYLHTCVHRHIHTYIHTYIHAYIQASMNVIYAATDKQLAGKGGAYIDNCKVVPRTY
jgi:hypothetical protein